jgi:hypothetical protein
MPSHFRKLMRHVSPDCPAALFPRFGTLRLLPIWVLEEKTRREEVRSENPVTSAVRLLSEVILIRMLSEEFEQWIARLHGCTPSGGEYLEENISELMNHLD